MVLPRFISAALSGEDLVVYGDGKQSRCFTHINDAIAAILKVSDSQAAIGEVFNIGNDQEISINELAKLVISRTASKSSIVSKSYQDAYGSGFEDLVRRVPDITKIKRVLGWAPNLGLNEIISDIVAFNQSAT